MCPSWADIINGNKTTEWGRELNKVLYGEAPPWGPNPYPFYIPFLIEKIPLLYTFHRKLYPFSIPTEQLLPHFSLQKPLIKILGWISCWVRLFEIFWKCLFIPKWQFPQPFYVSPAWKGYPFRAEPPRIVHYRESPPTPVETIFGETHIYKAIYLKYW